MGSWRRYYPGKYISVHTTPRPQPTVKPDYPVGTRVTAYDGWKSQWLPAVVVKVSRNARNYHVLFDGDTSTSYVWCSNIKALEE